MNNWNIVHGTVTGDDHTRVTRDGVVLDYYSTGHNINLYASLWVMWDYCPGEWTTHKNKTTSLKINLERFWQRPYMAISAAQREYIFNDVSLKEADAIFDEMLEHMRNCPEVIESNGKKVAKCSHYQNHARYQDSEYEEGMIDKVYPTAAETQAAYEGTDVIAVSM